MKIALLPIALLVVSCCPEPAPLSCPPPPPSGSDGWCEVAANGCPSSSPHAFRLCGSGDKAAPIPSRCKSGSVVVAASDGAMCCP